MNPAATRSDELPLVSIITPSYNQAAFLPETLQSVADQDYARIQHIVMDGGSGDGSVEIIRRWSETHPIAWRSAPDGGQADAIRSGLELATGDIVAWLNSDDIYLDSVVVTDVVRLFLGGASIVTGGGWYIDEAGNRERLIPVFSERLEYETLKHVDWVLQPATFVRRDLLLSCPIDVNLHYAFDWDLFIRLVAKAKPTPIFRELAGYRQHASGKTVSGGARRQRELLEVTRRYQGRRSLGYAVLAPIVGVHRLTERLPFGLYPKVAHVLNAFAAVTQRLPGWRGIQY